MKRKFRLVSVHLYIFHTIWERFIDIITSKWDYDIKKIWKILIFIIIFSLFYLLSSVICLICTQLVKKWQEKNKVVWCANFGAIWDEEHHKISFSFFSLEIRIATQATNENGWNKMSGEEEEMLEKKKNQPMYRDNNFLITIK